MQSKMIMTKNINYKQNEVRNIVDTVRVKVPRSVKDDDNCLIVKPLIENYSNFNKSGPLDRVMCYEDGSWVDLEGSVLEVVKLGFVERKPVVEVVLSDGSKWLVDFYRMMMVDLDSEDRKSIAWIDVDRKCFFPKRFFSSGNCAAEKVPEIEIEINVRENLNKRSREDVEFDSDEGSCSESSKIRKVVSSDEAPELSPEMKKRKLILSDCESARWPKAKLLSEEDKAYQIVKKLFMAGSGLGGATITGIHQYIRSGPLDKARNEVFQKQVEITKKARGGEANSTFAWLGTSAKGVESILAYGFGMPSSVPDSEAHGVGVYLSPVRSPHIGTMLSEVDDNGERHAILCRIILGKCEKVEARSQQSYPSSVNFDTGVDDLANPKWYIVWCANMNTHLLPECVVSYRLSCEVPGRLNVSPVSRLMQNGSSHLTALLLSRLGSSLPVTKAQELRTLCGGYKDGKLSKDIFVKQLRSIAGDEMLFSTFREIRGQH